MRGGQFTKALTILVDMDDTIEDLLTAWVTHLNTLYGTNVNPDDISQWNIAKAFPALTAEQVYSPINSNAFWYSVKPIEGAADTLKSLLNDGHNIFIVTASAYETVPAKMNAVLFRYFPFLTWENVIITCNKQMIKGDVLVDDGVHNLEGGEYLKILMDAPHNRNYNAEQNGMFRVKNWSEAYALISRHGEEDDMVS